MMVYVDFDPGKHRGMRIFEIQSVEVDGYVGIEYIPMDVPFEVAAETPWYYVVEVEG